MNGSDLHAGWYLLAFTDEITDDLTPVTIGRRRLMVIRREHDVGTTFEVADATCPHRGASLAHGGELRGSCVACPFHGRLVHIGDHDRRLSVTRHQSLTMGPLLFVRLGQGEEGDATFSTSFLEVVDGRRITTAARVTVDVPVEYVVENAFDTEHFSPVHDVPNLEGMVAERHPEGHLTIGGDFLTVHDPWFDLRYAQHLNDVLGVDAQLAARRRSAFRATAYSPTVVATSFGTGARNPLIITGALPTPEGCQVRVAVAGDECDPVEHIAAGSRLAMQQDSAVWEHIDPDAPTQLDERDVNVIAFREFCADFPRLSTPSTPSTRPVTELGVPG